MLPDKLAFVDIETTGLSPRFGRIIEIGILRVENDKLVNSYHQLLNPETHLPSEIEMLTGITLHDLEDKPTFRQIKNEVLNVLDGCVFVAHNVRFDYSFLRHEFKRENIEFRCRHFCTIRLSRALFPNVRRHNLDAIIKRFDISFNHRHRAFEDARIIWKFYQEARMKFPNSHFQHAVNIALHRPNVPLNIKLSTLDNLPEHPGVYIFYGAKGIPLYVGKSKNLKERILHHFSADIQSSSEMRIAQQITSLETYVTAGELGALILEAKLIKKLLPLYNKVLRHKRELIALTKNKNNKYETVYMEVVQAINAETLNHFLGFFKSRIEAKTYLTEISKEYKLCAKLLGLEHTNTSCFGYRLDRCNGACIGKEDPLFYNLRFTAAFQDTKIKPWPFNGPIMINESDSITNTSEHFIIDKWCILGSIKKSSEVDQSSDLTNNHYENYLFDLDTYKILGRFLRNPGSLKLINQIDYKKIEVLFQQ